MIRISKVCLWAACILTVSGFTGRDAAAEEIVDLRPKSPASVFSVESAEVADSWSAVTLSGMRRQMKKGGRGAAPAAPPYVMPAAPDNSWGYGIGVMGFNSGPFQELMMDGVRTQGSVRNRLAGWGSEVDPAGSLYVDYGWSFSYFRGERKAQVFNPSRSPKSSCSKPTPGCCMSF
jgi:hypothetical protein